jgi:hypothetical protein
LKDNSVKRLSDSAEIRGEYLSNELKYFFLTNGVIQKLTPPYSLESGAFAAYFNQTTNTIACSIAIAAPDVRGILGDTTNLVAYLMNRP